MKNAETLTPKIRLRAYSQKEMAGFYEISNKVLNRWLIPFKGEIGPRIGHHYSPRQVKIIFMKLGIPQVTDLN